MGNLALKFYVKSKIFMWNLRMFYKIWCFSKYLYKNRIFHLGDPSLVLKVVQKFTELAWSEYKDTVIMSRSPIKSAALLGILINKYFETGSKVLLDQIMQVIRTDFILRERDGRKQ